MAISNKIFQPQTSDFATFAKPFSLCSNRFANPTPKMANAIFGSPARHPENDSESGIERAKNGIQKYTAEMKDSSTWDATAANERFHASGGVCPQTVLWEFGSLSPARTFVKPPPA